MKIKQDKNDILFSKMVRERDKNTCQFCGKTSDQSKIECSHFWGRNDKSNRFNPNNADALCWYCHQKNEGNKQGFYRTWKIEQLGKKVYNEMEKVHYQGYKKYGAYEKDLLNEILKRQYKDKEHLEKDWQVNW